ncbi:hydroxylamine reductase [uncultured Brachyspira sp.]|uniref:hydroxylamine reductase n=1 Tax=uncultured Brachyspira sp. TaxID=221953 RepID=UPI002583F13F|nr:hydroxylamine reductase [uncultured Brachyspira sp.]
MDNKMFCYQCQETMNNTGCTVSGVCGKKPDLAYLEDLLVHVTKGLSNITTAIRKDGGKVDKKVNHDVTFNLFTTITNANFDKEVFYKRIEYTAKLCNELANQVKDKSLILEESLWTPKSKEDMDAKSKKVGVLEEKDEDIRSLKETVIYGVKGLSAYMRHANILDYENEEVDAFIQRALNATLRNDINSDELLELVLETGKNGVDGMALLDKANTSTYGNPEMTKVNIGVGKNPGILVSGHDLKDIEILLKQTEGTGVDVYTHSEMLPAHYYPELKKYKHFVGNYGGAWWDQRKDFESFNGPILMTTNCIVTPLASYKDRVYTRGAAGFEGLKHIEIHTGKESDKDFTPIIEHAKKCEAPKEIESGFIVGGFAHNQVLSLKDKISEAVKSGAIKRFIVMGGCDGRHKEREYYTEFAQKLPKDTVILTAGCAKYRYNKLDLGDINGIPRVLDAGQCNDSYSLAVIALGLKDLFGLDDINDLPIVYNIAWYEQKAVIVLLSLLYLGVKNIHLGPTIPGFLSPNVVNILVSKFGISSISNVNDDFKKFNLML